MWKCPTAPLLIFPELTALFPIKPLVIDPELIVKLDKRPLAMLPLVTTPSPKIYVPDDMLPLDKLPSAAPLDK